MRYFKNFVLAFIFPFTLFTACKDQEIIEDPKPEIPVELNFAFNFSSANDSVSKNSWVKNDSVGVYAVVTGGQLAAANNPIHNLKLVFDGKNWISSGTWPKDIENLDFYAYFPYNSLATDPTNLTFKAQLSQVEAVNLQNSNFLTAKNTNIAKKDTIKLTFESVMAVVQLDVPLQGKAFGPGKTLKAMLNEVNSKLSINLATGDKSSSEPTDIQMLRIEKEGDSNFEQTYTYRAIIPAQQKNASTVLFKYTHEDRQNINDSILSENTEIKSATVNAFSRKLPIHLVHTVKIEAATFQMGSPITEYYRQTEETPHLVTLTKPYYIGKYEVTNAQFVEFLNANNIKGDYKWPQGKYPNEILLVDSRLVSYDYGMHWTGTKWEPAKGYEDFPAILVTWFGADEYARWIGAVLPTEAQWEYACRGGQTIPNPFAVGTQTKMVFGLANFYTERPYDTEKQGGYYYPEGLAQWPRTTKKVGSYEPNGYGIYDMHGNVWEWCSDIYSKTYYTTNPAQTPIVDPKGAEAGAATETAYVMRGGGWDSYAHRCRTAYREYAMPISRVANLGFRVAFKTE